MGSTQPKNQSQKLEGEGSYQATRRYNKGLTDALAKGDIESGAAAARRALEGPEGPELRTAEASAKQGPRVKARKAKGQ